ncbi:hypothetical protein VD0002_g6028 [Verticillium dahliae]|uniref:SET domain-containing protein n=2 Tax=Verticillium dahliae TaxID=27337 RepID=G2XB27_VERDV|nr:uncharacterized protein VDAG_07457 [Verticillium dahliae VdLs.17]KAH6702616.1 hypothetical protein EV126DRAFT_382994 [Verticillium dahliae]EGY16293.1 hypothetical protein VDAG_07457 [Verticillium dahliae VdLs.17]PNH36500.1 hypothetical protein BJF96_g76 [Verticillium dahliae]PNH39130.1 hypothetical protein VD0004_g7728 [Verticillium dahliae]PNH49828.1 hypothetical protein VD0003_g7317 [Verticillium dahliae]
MAPPQLPKNWPPHLPYITSPAYSKQLTPSQRAALRRQRPEDPDIPAAQTPTISPLVKITPITEATHPACGQSGLFTTRALKPGAFVLLYLGTVHGERPPVGEGGRDEADESDYDLWLDRDEGVAVDAARGGNEARFVNDYRGVAARPNAEFREVWSRRFGERCMGVFVLPAPGRGQPGKGGVGKGQEILVSYGKGFWNARSRAEG